MAMRFARLIPVAFVLALVLGLATSAARPAPVAAATETDMASTILSMLISLTLFGSSLAFAEDAKPIAVCNDGKTMYSSSDKHQGACRGHGGVKSWADGSPVRSKGGTRSYK